MKGTMPATFTRQAFGALMTVRVACHIVYDQGGGCPKAPENESPEKNAEGGAANAGKIGSNKKCIL